MFVPVAIRVWCVHRSNLAVLHGWGVNNDNSLRFRKRGCMHIWTSRSMIPGSSARLFRCIFRFLCISRVIDTPYLFASFPLLSSFCVHTPTWLHFQFFHLRAPKPLICRNSGPSQEAVTWRLGKATIRSLLRSTSWRVRWFCSYAFLYRSQSPCKSDVNPCKTSYLQTLTSSTYSTCPTRDKPRVSSIIARGWSTFEQVISNSLCMVDLVCKIWK